jgi:pilus assembly protein Flp/PilA
MTICTNLLRDEAGASGAEYAFLLAIIGTALALAAFALGQTIGSAMNNTSECIAGATSTTCG